MNTGDFRDSWCVYEPLPIGGLAAGAAIRSTVFRCSDPPRADSGTIGYQMLQVRGPGVDIVIRPHIAAADVQLALVGANTPSDFSAPTELWSVQLPGGATYHLPEILALALPTAAWPSYRSVFPYWQFVVTDKGAGQSALSWAYVRAGGWP